MNDESTDILRRYTDLAERFGAVVDSLTPVDWDASTSCEGWTGRDVVAHVTSTQRDFLAQHGITIYGEDDGTADGGAAGAATTDPALAWHTHDDRMRALLADPAVAGLEYEGVFGPSTIGQAITTFYGFDLIVHRWDLAQAAGRDEVLHDAELATVEASADGFGDHLYGDGICKAALDVPADADRQTAVLARLGRRAPARADAERPVS